MGAAELQIFVSLIIVLGAAFVALICDFLKGTNERLREANIELRVRDHERERHVVYLERTQRYAAEAPSPFLEEFAEAPEPAPLAAVEAEPGVETTVPMPLEPVTSGPVAVRETLAETAAFATPAPELPVAELSTSTAVEPQVEAYEPPAVELQAPLEVGAAPGLAPRSLPVPVEAVLSSLDSCLPETPVVPSGGEPPAIEFQAPLHVDAVAAGGLIHAVVPPFEAPQAATTQIPSLLTPLADQTPALDVPPADTAIEPPFHGRPQAVRVTGSAPAVSGAPSIVAPISAEWVTREPESATPALTADLISPLDLPAPASLLPLHLAPCDVPRRKRTLAVYPLPVEIDLLPPESEPQPSDVLEPIAASLEELVPAEPVTNAIRIRVLEEEAVLPPSESLWLETEPQLAIQSVRIDLLPVAPLPAAAHAGLATVDYLDLAAPEPFLPGAPTLGGAGPALADLQIDTALHPRLAPPARARRVLAPQFELDASPELPLADLVPLPPPAARGIVVEMPPPPPRPDAELAVPGGLQEASVLGRLLAQPEPFHGLVVSVSLFEYGRLVSEQGRATIDALLESVERSLLSLIRESDFMCRSAEDELILLFPRETGPSAQRRLTQISERLWDFQLRSLGTMSVFFSWGASEAERAPLTGLVHQAREQMLETRRTRRGAINLAPKTGRRTVNG